MSRLRVPPRDPACAVERNRQARLKQIAFPNVIRPHAREGAVQSRRSGLGGGEKIDERGLKTGFATIYSEVALAIKAARTGKKPPKGVMFPTIDDGMKSLAFVEAAVKSGKANAKWVRP
jgi:hypothetical protein